MGLFLPNQKEHGAEKEFINQFAVKPGRKMKIQLETFCAVI